MPEIAGPARVWCAAGVYHPSPHEAVVLVSGGSGGNILMGHGDSEVENVQNDSIMHFGNVIMRAIVNLNRCDGLGWGTNLSPLPSPPAVLKKRGGEKSLSALYISSKQSTNSM